MPNALPQRLVERGCAAAKPQRRRRLNADSDRYAVQCVLDGAVNEQSYRMRSRRLPIQFILWRATRNGYGRNVSPGCAINPVGAGR